MDILVYIYWNINKYVENSYLGVLVMTETMTHNHDS